MTPYQTEQVESLEMVRNHLKTMPESQIDALRSQTAEYLAYRKQVRAFLSEYFGHICLAKCYESRLSACCSKDGIITFFADVVINALISTDTELDRITEVLRKPHEGIKCIYLSSKGCMWKLKPINCELFLCDEAEHRAFQENPEAGEKWNEILSTKKRYTWPDRPVLFDRLEKAFMDAGCKSPLMYLHNSPGLLRVKHMAAKKTK